MATNMTFVDFATPVPADWLNNVNAFVNAPPPAVTYQTFVNVKSFGAVGDGVHDDTAAIQAAINSIDPYIFQGTTRATELNATSGTVYFPAGTYLVTAKIRLTPQIRLVGDGCGSDFPARNGINGVGTGGTKRMGTMIYSTYSNQTSYAFDTSFYDQNGNKQDDQIINGTPYSSFLGTATQMPAIAIENMAFLGNWTSRGFNMAGAEQIHFYNVYIKGFNVGVRLSSVFYGLFTNVRIVTSWKGIIMNGLTDMNFVNTSVIMNADGVTYNVGVSGSDAGLPPVVNDLTTTLINNPTAINSYYSNSTGYGCAFENLQQIWLSENSTDNYHSVYVEGCSGILCVFQGSDTDYHNIHFDTITTNTGDILWSSLARVNISASGHNQTQGGFHNLVNFLNTGGSRNFTPCFRDIFKNASDTVNDYAIRYIATDYNEGGWTPQLTFGTNPAGTHTLQYGRWVRVGRMVFVTYRVVLSKGAATGNASITGPMPFLSDSIQSISTAFPLGNVSGGQAGMLGQVQPNTQVIFLINNNAQVLTDTAFSGSIDLQGSVQYMIQPGQ